jgi:hypothetical protein
VKIVTSFFLKAQAYSNNSLSISEAGAIGLNLFLGFCLGLTMHCPAGGIAF